MNKTLDIQFPNLQNARVMYSNGSIYLLNGLDLFVVNAEVRSGDKSSLKKIGSLEGVENQPISDIKVTGKDSYPSETQYKKKIFMCQASPWRDYTIFVADLDDYSNVYVVKANEPTDSLYPIEKLTKHGTTCEVKLFHFNQQLYCAIVDVDNEER